MSSAARETVEAALASALGGLSGVTVERIRARPVAREALPALIVGESRQTPLQTGEGVSPILMAVPIEGFVKAATDAALGPALNDLRARAVDALVADRTLGGAAVDSYEGEMDVAADEEEGHAPVASFRLEWIVLYDQG